MDLSELQQLKADFGILFREFGEFRQRIALRLGAFHAQMCRLSLQTECIINKITGDYGPDPIFDARREARALLGVQSESSDGSDDSVETDESDSVFEPDSPRPEPPEDIQSIDDHNMMTNETTYTLKRSFASLDEPESPASVITISSDDLVMISAEETSSDDDATQQPKRRRASSTRFPSD